MHIAIHNYLAGSYLLESWPKKMGRYRYSRDRTDTFELCQQARQTISIPTL